MFRHLRNRLICINLFVTTIVLAVSFSAIYTVAYSAAQHRKEIITSASASDDALRVTVQSIKMRIENEQRESLASLLASLIIVGILEEIAVAILSYILAEAAIQPVREAYESQKAFIANASHEMKTPIAAIMANLEVAEITGNPWIDNVSHEVQVLSTLNQELLTLARAENAMNVTKKPETVILKDLVEETLAPFLPRVKQQKVKYTFETKMRSGKVKLVRNDFVQIISILMDNALKYCDRIIIIKLTSKSFEIKNDGAKISEADLAHIFDRFYQADKSTEGVGLGLAIAKSLADREDWRLTAKSDEMTSFKLEF